MALGHEDFGLYGVVGSLVIFVSFFNIQFSVAIGRYYAVSIGKVNVSSDKESALEDCRRWFSTALFIHSVLPVLLIMLGYPIGAYAISNGWLTIPPEKIETCVWIWRYLSVSCFISMVSVPFQAMYVAKQYIAEVTIYSVLQVIAKTAFIYYMAITPRDWLRDYGLAMCIIAIVPQLLICWRATCVFSECRFRYIAFFDPLRIRQLAAYAFWQMFAGIGFLARHQCLEVVVNKFYGPTVNASYTIGATVGGESAALTGALNVAFTPAITTKFGENAIDSMRAMAYRSCKFGTFLTLIFAVPMLLEINEILKLWLVNPPPGASIFCIGWLCAVVIEKLTLGHCQAVNANGDVAKFMFVRGLACLTAIPLTIVAACMSSNVKMFCFAFVVAALINCVTDVIFAKRVTGMRIGYWFVRIVVPLLCVAIVSLLLGLIVVLNLQQSCCRMIITTVVVELAFFLMAFLWLLDCEEKAYVASKIRRLLRFE